MDAALDDLKRAICTRGEMVDISQDELSGFAEQCVVALAAGGQGSRLQAITGAQGVHKTILRLPNGETMMERTIRMYREAGFRDFVVLVYHEANSIIEVLGDGSKLGVRVTYSHDPEIPVGRGGAIRNALENGSIPRAKSLIVHNPDDVIVRYPGSFPQDMVAAHLGGTRRGTVATAVVVEGSRAAYTGMRIKSGVVEEVVAYPLVPIPAHIGVTIFSPDVYDSFVELFSLTEKVDFEGVLFPLLAQQRRLYTAIIPNECWLAVNDPKALNALIKMVRDELEAVGSRGA